MKKFVLIVIIGLVGAVGWWVLRAQGDTPGAANGDTNTALPGTFDTKAHSLNAANSLWLVVNKQRPLSPASYEPADLVTPAVALRLQKGSQEMLLRRQAANALEGLFAAAAAAGHRLLLASAYRSFDYQKGLYNYYVNQQGQAVADTQSARPGYSEHQTGLAADVGSASRHCEVETCFADTPEGQWVAAHAHEYGFIIRYPQGKDSTTGYIYEPWHLRYVGDSLAAELHKQGNPTLEEFFGLPAAANY